MICNKLFKKKKFKNKINKILKCNIIKNKYFIKDMINKKITNSNKFNN
jgi:hypothetical protein